MNPLEFDAHALDDPAWWIKQDRKIALWIVKLLREIQRTPFEGTVAPGPTSSPSNSHN